MNIVALVTSCAPSDPPGNVLLYLQVTTEIPNETGLFEPFLMEVELDFDHIPDDQSLQQIMESAIRQRMETRLGRALLPGDHIRMLGTSYTPSPVEPPRPGFWRRIGRRLGPPDHKLVNHEIIG